MESLLWHWWWELYWRSWSFAPFGCSRAWETVSERVQQHRALCRRKVFFFLFFAFPSSLLKGPFAESMQEWYIVANFWPLVGFAKLKQRRNCEEESLSRQMLFGNRPESSGGRTTSPSQSYNKIWHQREVVSSASKFCGSSLNSLILLTQI